MNVPIHFGPAVLGAWRVRQNPQTATVRGYRGLVEAALEAGVVWVDHADIYDDGAVETLHGDALREAPEVKRRVRIITKCGVRVPSPGQKGVHTPHYRSDGAYIRASVEHSLKRLGAERIDCLLLHRPDYLMDAGETGGVLDALIDEGKVASAGVSNFTVAQIRRLQAAMRHHLVAHQLEFSLLASAALDDGRLDHAMAERMTPLAWSPLGGGRLFGDGPDRQRVAAWAGSRHPGVGLDELALRWIARHPAGIVPVLGTTRVERLRRQVQALRAPAMDIQDWYGLLQAARGVRIP